MDDDTQSAAQHQQMLEQQQRREQELRNCTNRGRCWLPSDDLPCIEDLQVIPINWEMPF